MHSKRRVVSKGGDEDDEPMAFGLPPAGGGAGRAGGGRGGAEPADSDGEDFAPPPRGGGGGGGGSRKRPAAVVAPAPHGGDDDTDDGTDEGEVAEEEEAEKDDEEAGAGLDASGPAGIHKRLVAASEKLSRVEGNLKARRLASLAGPAAPIGEFGAGKIVMVQVWWRCAPAVQAVPLPSVCPRTWVKSHPPPTPPHPPLGAVAPRECPACVHALQSCFMVCVCACDLCVHARRRCSA
jgi:hypothetical protein